MKTEHYKLVAKAISQPRTSKCGNKFQIKLTKTEAVHQTDLRGSMSPSLSVPVDQKETSLSTGKGIFVTWDKKERMKHRTGTRTYGTKAAVRVNSYLNRVYYNDTTDLKASEGTLCKVLHSTHNLKQWQRIPKSEMCVLVTPYFDMRSTGFSRACTLTWLTISSYFFKQAMTRPTTDVQPESRYITNAIFYPAIFLTLLLFRALTWLLSASILPVPMMPD